MHNICYNARFEKQLSNAFLALRLNSKNKWKSGTLR